MSLLTDEIYNNLEWHKASIEELQELIQGAKVLETEAIDFPLIDGVDLTLRDKEGRLIVVSFNADTENYININDVIRSHKSQQQHRQYLQIREYEDAEGANPLYIMWAEVPDR